MVTEWINLQHMENGYDTRRFFYHKDEHSSGSGYVRDWCGHRVVDCAVWDGDKVASRFNQLTALQDIVDGIKKDVESITKLLPRGSKEFIQANELLSKIESCQQTKQWETQIK